MHFFASTFKRRGKVKHLKQKHELSHCYLYCHHSDLISVFIFTDSLIIKNAYHKMKIILDIYVNVYPKLISKYNKSKFIFSSLSFH